MSEYDQNPLYPRNRNGKLLGAARTWMIVTLVMMIVMMFPTFGMASVGLAWCIPMLILISRIRDGKMPNTVMFGIICLIIVGIVPIVFFTYILWWGVSFFFSTGIIPGVLLLVAEKDKPEKTAGQQKGQG